MKKKQRWIRGLLLLWMILTLGLQAACAPEAAAFLEETVPAAESVKTQETETLEIETQETETLETETAAAVVEDGTYSGKEEVALYLHLYGHLPDNYLTKKEAQALGWEPSKKNLWEVAPGMSIGGDRFGNYEGLLPEAKGRQYYECDIDYDGGGRNAKRIIFSNDGLIFYTGDHYGSFEPLWEQEGDGGGHV